MHSMQTGFCWSGLWLLALLTCQVKLFQETFPAVGSPEYTPGVGSLFDLTGNPGVPVRSQPLVPTPDFPIPRVSRG